MYRAIILLLSIKTRQFQRYQKWLYDNAINYVLLKCKSDRKWYEGWVMCLRDWSVMLAAWLGRIMTADERTFPPLTYSPSDNFPPDNFPPHLEPRTFPRVCWSENLKIIFLTLTDPRPRPDLNRSTSINLDALTIHYECKKGKGERKLCGRWNVHGEHRRVKGSAGCASSTVERFPCRIRSSVARNKDSFHLLPSRPTKSRANKKLRQFGIEACTEHWTQTRW